MPKNLTDTALKSLKPKENAYKVADGTIGGLFVAVSPKGKKVFRLNFAFAGKAQLLTIGAYPEFTLSDAREAALAAKKEIAQGRNPCAEKKAAKTKAKADAVSFADMTQEWLAKVTPTWSQHHAKDVGQKLDCHILPRLGHIPMSEVTKADIKAVLDGLDAQGKFPTLRKCRSIISLVFQYAIALEHPGVEFDWTAMLRSKNLFTPTKVTHRAALTSEKDIAQLMKAISAYDAMSKVTRIALQFSALTFCRPGEIRHAEWKEINFEEKLWRIPAEKMKMGKPHLVPLANQTIEILCELIPMTNYSRYLFPSIRTADRPMSEMTITAALRRMGYNKSQMCAHGFRGLASTSLNEQGYNRDWIEIQLAHSADDKIRAAYNHAQFLAQRRDMMQKWADYLFMLEQGE